MLLHDLIYSNRRFARILSWSYVVSFGAANKPVVGQTYVANLIMFCDLIPI